MSQPRTFYITEFPSTFKDDTWWHECDKERAESFLKHVKEKYGIEGKIVEVVEVKPK